MVLIEEPGRLHLAITALSDMAYESFHDVLMLENKATDRGAQP
jgi:hypothetical protein